MRQVLLWLLALALWVPVQAQSGTALVLEAEGPVTPGMLEYVQRGIRRAEQSGATVLILRLNTPGGAVDTMERIVQAIRASQVPVVVFVAPRGAIAGSAGTVITLAGHAAAMAPETAIGAASPVGSQGEDLGETLDKKAKEILKATVRSLAAGRPPEAIQLAEATIEEARAASAQEALDVGMIDFIAEDVSDLLRQLDGRTVQTASGPRTLATAGLQAQVLDPSFIEQLLQVLTNPEVALLLLFLGGQAILFELASPGGWVAGFIGVVSLALAFYALGVLPVNWFGLIFIGTAFVLFLLEVKAPTHGALAAAGIASLIVGALVLFNSPGTPEFARVSLPAVIGISLATAAFFITIVTFAVRAQKRPAILGPQALIGQVGEARTELSPGGTVQVAGELWSAELEAGNGGGKVPPGQAVEVVGLKGLKLRVRPLR